MTTLQIFRIAFELKQLKRNLRNIKRKYLKVKLEYQQQEKQILDEIRILEKQVSESMREY